MIGYTRTSVNLWSFIFTILIMFILYLFPIETQSKAFSKQTNIGIKCLINIPKIEEDVNSKTSVQTKTKLSTWKIIIPAINLEADIAEGTSTTVMDKYVGHFENTPKLDGNIALGAHNRGYSVNYFQDLKKLKKGDIIRYIYNGIEKKYYVETIAIIKDTDWTYLQNTTKDKITLITCVENQPEYRHCIQGAITN